MLNFYCLGMEFENFCLDELLLYSATGLEMASRWEPARQDGSKQQGEEVPLFNLSWNSS